jgi:hypothetical protein
MGTEKEVLERAFRALDELNQEIPSKPTEPEPSKPSKPTDPEELWAYCAAKADRINRFFAEHGTAGPAKIKPSTVKDGLLKSNLNANLNDRPVSKRHLNNV